MKVSIIVPVAADDAMRQKPLGWRIPADWQLIIAAAPDTKAPPMNGSKARWMICPRAGRAAQMNAAAAFAAHDWLWFVHADTVLYADTCETLRAAIGNCPPPAANTKTSGDSACQPPVLYFDLRFVDGGAKMRINEWGVRLRCALFGNPFGDQALCMTRAAWQLVGGFDEEADYGEDHLLVLRAQKKGIKARRIPAAVGTSARRYVQDGWWRTVLLYRRLWMRQYRRERGG